jgi:hypothetical protein
MPLNPDGHTRQLGFDVNATACHAIRLFLDAELLGHGHLSKELRALVDQHPEAMLSHSGPMQRQPKRKAATGSLLP